MSALARSMTREEVANVRREVGKQRRGPTAASRTHAGLQAEPSDLVEAKPGQVPTPALTPSMVVAFGTQAGEDAERWDGLS